jgi:hypothetical protein
MNRKILGLKCIVLSTIAFSFAEAVELSPESLYYRCYAHLTRSRPPVNDTRLPLIRSGLKSYIDACMEVFDLGNLDKVSGALVVETPESIKVLENFNRFHMSWFDEVSVFNALPPGGENMNHFLHDGGENALHFTRALFHPDGLFKDAVTSNDTYQAIRSKAYNTFGIWPTTTKRADKWGNKDVTIFVNGVETALSAILDPMNTHNGLHIQMGKLTGIMPMEDVFANDALHSSVAVWPPVYSAANKANITQSFGGGILGTQPYIMLNRIRNPLVHEDGGLMSGRVWSKQVFKEILCRDIPVVQSKDVVALVDQSGTNPFPFRNNSSCMQCHASIDPMAWSIRNIRLSKLGNNPLFTNVLYFLEKYAATPLASEAGPVHGLGAGTVADTSFYKRPPKGHLYFRTFTGSLVSEQVEGLDGAQGLGEAIANLDDYYVCASKRYFEFFTGHKVIIEDITDINSTKLNDKQLRLRNFTIGMGKKLRQTQKLRDVVKEIFGSDFYKNSDYEIKY